MPQGVSGFQPGRKKTGGRVSKEEKIRQLEEKMKGMPRSAKLVDQLAIHGFDFHKALAQALKAVTSVPKDVETYKKAVVTFEQLTDLLPFMAPKLREREVDTAEPQPEQTAEDAISDEDLLKALNASQPEDNKRTSRPANVEPRNAELLLPTGADDHLSDVASEQEEL